MPKRQYIKFRRWRITKKKAYNHSEHGEGLKSRKCQFLTLCVSFLMSRLEALESRIDSRWALWRLLFHSPPSLFECR